MNKACLLLVSMMMLFGMVACSEAFTGKYINTKDSSEFIDIHANGTFALHESGMKAEGTYRLEKSKVLFDFKMYGKSFTAKAELVDGRIRDEQGKVWAKSNVLPPILISAMAALLAIGLYLATKKISNKTLQGAAQIGAVFAGIIVIIPFAEDAGQARNVLGSYYFYILFGVAVISMVASKLISAIKSGRTKPDDLKKYLSDRKLSINIGIMFLLSMLPVYAAGMIIKFPEEIYPKIIVGMALANVLLPLLLLSVPALIYKVITKKVLPGFYIVFWSLWMVISVVMYINLLYSLALVSLQA